MTARERIQQLIDPDTPFFELGLWAGWEMYAAWGGAPAAGVICGIGTIAGRRQMIIANDATVKAGAFFPATAKKVLRAQRIAFQNRLPLVYLVDSAGVFLPLQEDVFPDEDDFGRIFRNNAVISAAGIGQLAAIMGNCVAGGGYLPVLCDKLLMTEGSGLYLAGPALVKSAIGQEVSSEELGGAEMHAQISGTIDYRDPDDAACLARLRRLASAVAPDADSPPAPSCGMRPRRRRDPGTDVYDLVSFDPRRDYEVREVLDCILDADSFDEYKAEYGQSLVCGTARLGGFPVGIVANQHHQVRPAERSDAVRRRAVRRQRGEGGPLRDELQPGLAADRVPAGRQRLHGRPRERAGGHHQGRRQAGQRHQQQPRSQADRVIGRLVRRRQLRAVRQGLRPAADLRLALGRKAVMGGEQATSRCWT